MSKDWNLIFIVTTLDLWLTIVSHLWLCAIYCLTMGSSEWLDCLLYWYQSIKLLVLQLSCVQLSANWPTRPVRDKFLMCAWISHAQLKLSGLCNIIQLWLCASYTKSKMTDHGIRSHLFVKMYTFWILLFLKTITKIILSNVIEALFLCCELFLAMSPVGFLQGNWREFQQSGNVGPRHFRQLQWKSVERASLQTDCWLSQAWKHCSIRSQLQLQIIWRYICRLLSWTTIAHISPSIPSMACNAYLTIFKALYSYVI